MTCTPSLAARSARPSPTRRFRSSDSTTQGPAMRNGAEPKCGVIASLVPAGELGPAPDLRPGAHVAVLGSRADEAGRSGEHTSELQSLAYTVCRLLLEKKKRRGRSALRPACSRRTDRGRAPRPQC